MELLIITKAGGLCLRLYDLYPRINCTCIYINANYWLLYNYQ